jgi:protein involved in polysaccharide export with SLBB domain
MKTTLRKNSIYFSGLIILLVVGVSFAQTTENTPAKRVNFGYSQNPKTKTKKEIPVQNNQTPKEISNNTQQSNIEENNPANETIAQKTLAVVKNANKKALAPTENYKVGVGDILFINLQNSSKGSTLFTVLNDGTIDYPLANEMVPVTGLTTEEIEDVLREKVKLYENPQVSVKVRDYSSHKITVLGLVEKSGEKYLQREAVPLFVVRAEVFVQPGASRVVIRRADSTTESFSLKDEKSENTLIFPNDIIEFSSDDALDSKNGQLRFFFIGGEVASVGKKDFYEGLTLTQAILAAGGLKKESIKKIVIRRKNAEGLLVSTEYNLKLIKDGKVPDPVLQAGDTIEVGS